MRFAALLPLVLATTALAGPFKRQQETRPACNRTPEVTICRGDSECATDERCQFVTRNPDMSGCNGACIKRDPAPSSSSTDSSTTSSTTSSSTTSPTPSPPAGNTCPFVFGQQQCRGNDCSAGQTCQFVTRNADGSGCDGYCAETTPSSSSTTSSSTTSSPTSAPSPVTTCAANLDCPTTQYCNQKGQCATYADCRATADSCPGGTCTNEKPLSGPTYQAIRDPYQPFICSFNSTSSSSSSSSTMSSSSTTISSSSSSTVSPTSSLADCRTTGCAASDYCVFVKQGYLCMPKPSDLSSSTTSTSSSSSDASVPTTPPATDCRTIGCATSETCIFVKQGYLCMPKPTEAPSSDAHPAPTPAPTPSSPCPESSTVPDAHPAPSPAPAPAPSPAPSPESHPAPAQNNPAPAPSWKPDSNSGANPSTGHVSDKVTGSMESAAILSLLREIKADIAALKEDVNKIKVKIGA